MSLNIARGLECKVGGINKISGDDDTQASVDIPGSVRLCGRATKDNISGTQQEQE